MAAGAGRAARSVRRHAVRRAAADACDRTRPCVSPKLLMLDEPSMGLSPAIADFIFERLIEIRRQSKLTILLVEQRVAEALESADHGYVLEAGRIALEGSNQTLRSDDRVRRAYLGM